MKKIIYYIIVVTLLCSCTKKEETEETGIYGVVTDKTSAEPMRSTGVELHVQTNNSSFYPQYSLLTRTVTYDDGHYEFNDLKEGNYKLKVVAEGYKDTEYDVVVETGRIAKGDMQLEKINTYLTVRTLDITDISGNSATLNGSASSSSYSYSIKERGFVYATHSNPVNGGTKITASSDFVATVTNLSKATYYVCAYAKNSLGTEYGEERSFQITGAPSVTTLPATNVTGSAATLNGKIEYQGDPAYTERGFVYSSTFQNPTIEDDASATTKNIVSGTSTEFSANVTGLQNGTNYYIRAYATNSDGTVYGISVSSVVVVNYIVLQSDGIMVQKNDISSGASWYDASTLCKNSRNGGYSDWRLPTLGELQTLYKKKETIGGFTTERYWSSSPSSYSSYYYMVNFSNGTSDDYPSSNTFRVRAVRALP